ncbi:hypothetical protein [Crateriforma spongiae]|uniref:hypothetical protein n=1 Tax=Crateriforma spongiae TaxID=2724528 RepID=UPI001445E568|nr:hypothetical protein [Crateriforma spongiae]
MHLRIDSRGTAHAIYDETIDLRAIGRLAIRRASHVEPEDGGTWRVDLSPVKGPILGPFQRRSEALAAETEWLSRHWLLPKPFHSPSNPGDHNAP